MTSGRGEPALGTVVSLDRFIGVSEKLATQFFNSLDWLQLH